MLYNSHKDRVRVGECYFWYRVDLDIHHQNRFMALFPGPPRWAGARRELWDFVVQGKINTLTIRLRASPSGLTGAHLHHPHFLQAGWPSNQQRQSTEG